MVQGRATHQLPSILTIVNLRSGIKTIRGGNSQASGPFSGREFAPVLVEVADESPLVEGVLSDPHSLRGREGCRQAALRTGGIPSVPSQSTTAA